MGAFFEESCLRFSKFLAENGYPSRLVWVRREDVLFGGSGRLYLKVPIPDANREGVRELFEAAMKKQSGISFHSRCESHGTALCMAWVPAADSERQLAMCSKTEVKMSAATAKSRLQVKEVRSHLYWSYLQPRYRKHQAFKDQLFWA